jgi:Holliday junction resolvase
MAEVQAAYPRGLDFEQVWARFDRIEAIVEKVARQQEATAEQAKMTDKRVGELTGRFGEVVEYMIVPNLVAKFRELGFEFTRAGPDVKIADREHDIHAEIDAFLENGDKVMIVEIKSKPNTDDVKDHVEKMEKLRRYADLKGDGRKYLGAIAGVVVGESVANYALKNGFYVIEPSGDTFNIIEPKGAYRPREW